MYIFNKFPRDPDTTSLKLIISHISLPLLRATACRLQPASLSRSSETHLCVCSTGREPHHLTQGPAPAVMTADRTGQPHHAAGHHCLVLLQQSCWRKTGGLERVTETLNQLNDHLALCTNGNEWNFSAIMYHHQRRV